MRMILIQLFGCALRQSEKASGKVKALCARVEKRSGEVKSSSAKPSYPQLIHKSLRGYPARHPSIVARIFALVKGKLKIIWRDICSLLC